MTTIQHHPNCTDNHCSVCLADHFALMDELDQRTGIDGVDHLGHFHKWLKDRGIEPETEFGWGSTAYFDESNISEYIKDWTE